MAKLSIELDTRSCVDGRYPVRFRLSINRTSAYIYTGVRASQEEFTGDKYKPLAKRAYMGAERTEMIARIARKYDEVYYALQYNGTLANMTANELREYICQTKQQIAKKEVKKAGTSSNDFLAYFDEYSECRNSPHTVKHYLYIGRVIRSFMRSKGLTALTFDDIDYNLLSDLKSWLRNTGRGEATRFKAESYIKAAYRAGSRKFHISRDKDPFFDYKIEKVPESDIEIIEPDIISRLISLDLTNQQGADSLERTRDILLASFCLGGANLIDLYNMPMIQGNSSFFVRHKVCLKTNRHVQIRISPQLAEIIGRNLGREKLFYWGEKYPSYESFRSKTNERCRRLSALLGAKVNMERIRRSFSTIAGDLEVPEDIIDKLLGHTDQTVLRKHYKRFNWSKASDYNDKVINYVFADAVPNSVKVPKLIRKAA